MDGMQKRARTHAHTQFNVKNRWETDIKTTCNESFCVCRAFGLTELLHLPLASMWLRQLMAVSGGSGDVVPNPNRAFHLMAAKWWCEHQRVPINTCFKSRYHSVTASSATSWSTDLNSFVLIEPGAQLTRFLFGSVTHSSLSVHKSVIQNLFKTSDYSLFSHFLRCYNSANDDIVSFGDMGPFWLTG